MLILGYIAAILIGFSLALIGGGGSILTMPVLVYLVGLSPLLSTTYSLFIVGVTALVGAGKYAKSKLVDEKTAIIFGIPSIIAVFFTRILILPAIPENFFYIGNFLVTRDIFIMLLFSILMIASSYSMIRSSKFEEPQKTKEFVGYNYWLIISEGAIVGMLTGLVGAGGGFLIIPALVLLVKLPMKEAIGTSLIIIAAKSLIGFAGDIFHTHIEWTFLLLFTAFAIAGIFIGMYISRFFSGQKLRPIFGWFVLFMGMYVIWKELQ